jgi:hypothetical protein
MTDWKQRESDKFTSGEYAFPTWALDLAPIQDHFAHASLAHPGLIAYTPSAEYGQRDRHTAIAPGRYLTKFYPELSGDDVREYAERQIAATDNTTVLFASTADEIERVYVNGPTSCMSGSEADFNSPIHPVRVYAAGDLAVAYIEAKPGKITARALCWPEKKLHSRLYGDKTRLLPALEALGYAQGRLDGARLLRMAKGGDYVMPYIDDSEAASEYSGEYLIIETGGNIDATNTCGLSSEQDEHPVCESCNEMCDEDEGYYIEDILETWCESCASGAHQCSQCQNLFQGNLATALAGTETRPNASVSLCDTCADEYAVPCAQCDYLVMSEASQRAEDGERYCPGCASAQIIPATASELEAAGQQPLPLETLQLPSDSQVHSRYTHLPPTPGEIIVTAPTP